MEDTADLLEMIARTVGRDCAGARTLGHELLAVPGTSAPFQARTLALLALADYLDAQYAEAIVAAERAMAVARSTGDSEALLYALGMRLFASGGLAWTGAEPETDHFALAWGMRGELDRLDPESRMIAGHLLIEGCIATGRLAEAGELLTELGDMRAARRPEDEERQPYLPFMLLQTARVLFFQGRIAEAVPAVEAVVVSAERAGDALWALLAQAYLALVSAHSGDRAATRRLTATLADAFPHPTGYLEGAVHCLSAYALFAIGDGENAARAAVRGGGGPTLPNLQVADQAVSYDLLVGVALAAGRLAEAEEWGSHALGLAGHPAGAPIVEQILARLDLARGNATTSADRAAVSAARSRLTGRYLDAARSDMLRARALATSGLRPLAARELLDVAAHAERDGDHTLRSSAVRELRSLGRRLPPPARGGWGALSERERQVAVLAAEGFDNRTIGNSLFLSERTVQSHLSRVLTAFGVSSRAALPSHVASLRLGQPRDDLPELTPRQREVAALIAQGVSNREIAETLGISVKTVEKHVAEILQRWGVPSRTAIARIVAIDGQDSLV